MIPDNNTIAVNQTVYLDIFSRLAINQLLKIASRH